MQYRSDIFVSDSIDDFVLPEVIDDFVEMFKKYGDDMDTFISPLRDYLTDHPDDADVTLMCIIYDAYKNGHLKCWYQLAAENETVLNERISQYVNSEWDRLMGK